MKKYIKYLKYALIHKWQVFVECAKRGRIWRGLVHDASKFSLSEFIPYVNHFYGTNNQDEFDRAWNRHQKRNKHHWQYWVLQKDDGVVKALEMPKQYAIEMLCDWYSAGRIITGENNLRTWYDENRHNIVLHSNTRNYVEHLIYNDLDPIIKNKEK